MKYFCKCKWLVPTGRIQSPSCRWIVPVGPYLWKVHLAICVIVMSSSSATLTLTNITTATMVHCCQGQQQEHHLWEDHGHGISSFFKFLLHHSPNLSALMIMRESITNLAKFRIFYLWCWWSWLWLRLWWLLHHFRMWWTLHPGRDQQSRSACCPVIQ